MAAKIIEKTFDPSAGAVVVTIEDDLGVRSVHTLHVLEPDGSDAQIARHMDHALAQADERSAKISVAFKKHGWSG
ncbi:MAG: hypothetical protein GZ088_13330 [Acidipila sp.]|nr:hypothetical protein [Acidipila sp.]